MAEAPSRRRRSTKRTTRRTSQRTSQRRSSASNPAANALNHINELVAHNAALQKEVDRLKSVLSRVGALVGDQAAALTGGGSGTRRRRSSGGGTSSATRTRRGSSSSSASSSRRRKPITDPEALERRRQALAKARAVRAEKRAQQKS
jgi:hypothetical protein